jgi:serine/threonine-protein phosphatase 2A activator
MIKMYNAEVLSKFPVVQHFRFGSLFSWETDPEAVPAPITVHTSSHPGGPFPSISGNTGRVPTARQVPQGDARAPWGQSSSQASISTAAPWAMPSTTTPSQAGGMPPTRAPWASASVSGNALSGGERASAPWATSSGPSTSSRDVLTRAPWANLAKPPNDPAVPKR